MHALLCYARSLKTASEMTYIVSGGALNSAQSNPRSRTHQICGEKSGRRQRRVQHIGTVCDSELWDSCAAADPFVNR